MVDAIDELKARARVLQRRVQAGDAALLAQLRELDEYEATGSTGVRRRHCLTLVARAFGFANWPHARAVLAGERRDDFGSLLYPDACAAHWNIWSASYAEAKAIRAEHGGYLLAYKRQFLVVDRHFIETLGLDPDDPDWEAIGRDWVEPANPAARERLYRRLVQNRARV